MAKKPKQPTKNKDLILRIPRPQGFTNLCISYNTNKTLQLGILRNITIKHFLSTNLLTPSLIAYTHKSTRATKKKAQYYRLKAYDLSDLAHTLMLSLERTELRISKYLAKSAKKLSSDGELLTFFQHTRVNFFSALKKSIHRHQDLLSWEDELKSISRAYFHKPGYAAQANTAISISNQHEAHILKVFQTLMDAENIPPVGQTVNIQNNIGIGHTQAPMGQEALTADKAIALLSAQGHTALPLENKAQHFIELRAKHDLDNMPEIKATFSDAQGVARAKSFDFTKASTHEDRRAEEVGDIIEATE